MSDGGMGYGAAQRAPAQKSADAAAAEHRTRSSGHGLAADTLNASLNQSPRAQSLMQLRAALDASPRVQAQLALQRALDKRRRPGKEAPVQKKPNATGMPDRLKDGIEQLSGLALDDVRVHYNSQRPAAVQAHAYAQGSDIHLGPGQEQHLPHEAWHVVQQKQGRVKPTLQLKSVAINDDAGLEREADAMGARVEQELGGMTGAGHDSGKSRAGAAGLHAGVPAMTAQLRPVMQLEVFKKSNGKYYSDLDPEQEFETREEALEFEANMEPPPPITGGRSATLFTYMATKSHNKLSTRGIPQGPHTQGHAAVETALYGSEGKIALVHLISEQVRSPQQWRDLMNAEYGRDMFDGKSEESRRIIRAYQAYYGLYLELKRVLAKESDENPYDLIHELIQLDVYTVYQYKNPKKVTKKQLKYKSENRDLSDSKNIDKNAKFKQKDKYLETLDDRALLMDEDYNEAADQDISDDETEANSDDDTTDHVAVQVDDALCFLDPDEIPQQGDCFFQCVQAVGLGSNRTVAELRRLAKSNGGKANVDQPGVWATKQDIIALANALGVRFRVIRLDLDWQIIGDYTLGNNNGPLHYLAHIFGGHFTPLWND